MSSWIAILLFAACAAAVVLWHNLARTKQVTDCVLNQYRDLLDNARQQILADQAKADAADGDLGDEPIVVGSADAEGD